MTKKEKIQEKLTNVRQELLSLLREVEDSRWESPVFAENTAWAASDLLCHIADSERGMTRLMAQIREGGEGVPPDFDLDRWNARVTSKMQDKTPAELVVEMESNRVQLFQFIDSLQEEDWDKKGRHASLRIMSIEEICHLIADHEQGHTQYLRRVLA